MRRKITLVLVFLLSTILIENSAAQDVILKSRGNKTYGGGSDLAWVDLTNPDISVARVQCDLLFDTDILEIENVTRKNRTEPISLFDWHVIEGGIHITLADSLSPIVTGHGPIAEIHIHASYGAPPGEYDLIIADATVQDSLGNMIPLTTQNGQFTIEHSAWLRITGPRVLPGSIGKKATVRLGSAVFVESLQFNLLYDKICLSATDVVHSPDSENTFIDVAWSNIDEGIHISCSKAAHPDGPWIFLLKIVFDIDYGVPRDTSYDLSFSDVVLTDSSGTEIPTDSRNGELSILPHDVSINVINGAGNPGSIDNEVPIYIVQSYIDLTALRFDLRFDTTNLTVTRVERAEASTSFSYFHWDSIPDGIRISMSDTNAPLPAGGCRKLATVFFDIPSEASRREYELTLSNVVLLDTLSNEALVEIDDGWFYVYSGMSSAVQDGGGFPGSRDNIIPFFLENDQEIIALQFDLMYDTDYLSISDVQRTSGTEDISFHLWSAIEGGARLSIFGFELGIPIGIGSIADIHFNVHEQAPLGEYDLTVDTLITSDHLGVPIPISIADGTFSVVQQGDVNGDGVVDITDVILTINIILKEHEPTPKERSVADCNDDNTVDVLDVVCIVNIILGK